MRQSKNWILLYALIVCMILIPIKAEARAGGGGGHVGGGGGHVGGGSSHTGSYGRTGLHSYKDTIASMGLGIAAFFGVWGVISARESIVFLYNTKKASKKAKQNMQSFKKLEDNWDEEELQKRIEEAYFEIQECWKREDETYAKEYLSHQLLSDFHKKLKRIRKQNEEVVQENVKLLSAVPVYAENQEGTKRDKVCYLIHGKMKAYYVDQTTKECVRGETKDKAFREYWYFIYEKGKWVLDRIKQEDEVIIKQFT